MPPPSPAPVAPPEDREVLAPAHTDWLYHHLKVTGAPGDVAVFQAAAAGAGVIPWTHDRGAAVEDWFHLLVAPPAPQRRTLSLHGARILVGQLRDAVEARGRTILERSPASRACPLDLHRLLPIPADILRHGPDAPAARAWLWQHWGTTQALRGVVTLPVPRRGQPPRRDPGLYWVGFWSADWSPWPALLALRQAWPALSFDLRPLYQDV